jgi:hypothetical protein
MVFYHSNDINGAILHEKKQSALLFIYLIESPSEKFLLLNFSE